jgi:hypothetical protein
LDNAVEVFGSCILKIRKPFNQSELERARLKPASITNRTLMNESSQVCSVGGRVLILLTALLLAVTPWTEYVWHFDNFLHGGQDMELGLLSIVTVFCLVLVLLQDGKQRVTSRVVIRQWQSSVFDQADPPAPGSFPGLNMTLDAILLPGSSSGTYNSPIRV